MRLDLELEGLCLKTSKIPKFYEKSLGERLAEIKEFGELSEEETALLGKYGNLDFETANRMIENVFSTFPLPLGIATNFVVNGREVLVPFALEEPSVVAAASNSAKLCSGFEAKASEPIMIGQVQIVGFKTGAKARAGLKKIMSRKKGILEKAMSVDSTLVKFGGGPRKLEGKVISTKAGKMIIVHLLVDVRDAMGANAVNTMCERISPLLEEISGGKTRLKIISNLAVHRTVKAKGIWKKEVLGKEVIDAVLDAYEFAANDEFRACTHNKGIMNGIDAVAIATGNDWRAIEAGAHAYAAREGNYGPLTHYEKDADGNLAGTIELPMAVGTVGGSIGSNQVAKIALKILGAKSGKELAMAIACVGLANNFAALRALSTSGIQKGHMRLNARNLAAAAGAQGKEIEEVAASLEKEGVYKAERAREILKIIRSK
ncbi:3-hydroxy-3-methylglutaryl-coenzyme A reductase [uncultured archaeon]|nr:3-hydroxy-3-methylglutaryl-coenzyme A reductase [uncultured archaeon]